ncbi:MAG TPA: hypothetical protein VNW92_04645 [Polyangiaceae bacterium]|jgi:hypothetical protein|nr:hypothetical protein [Polyangiaceae bacterium]
MKIVGVSLPVLTDDMERAIPRYEALTGERVKRRFVVDPERRLTMALLGSVTLISGDELRPNHPKPRLARVVVRHRAPWRRPEPRGVVRVLEVHELVDDHVIARASGDWMTRQFSRMAPAAIDALPQRFCGSATITAGGSK